MCKKIIMLILALVLVSCGNTKKVERWYDIGNGNNTVSFVDTLHHYQLDSLCNADYISRDFKNDWLSTSARDYETRKPLKKYLYVKTMRDSSEVLYTLRTIDIPYDTLYVVEKRITYYENEE